VKEQQIINATMKNMVLLVKSINEQTTIQEHLNIQITLLEANKLIEHCYALRDNPLQNR